MAGVCVPIDIFLEPSEKSQVTFPTLGPYLGTDKMVWGLIK